MRKEALAGKIVLSSVFGILGTLSILMFPFLIGSDDSKTSIIGYSYLGLLIISIFVIFIILKKELKSN